MAISAPPAAEPPDLLVVDDIEVVYDGAILAVSGVSLKVADGAIVALLGANGAGKSTTLKAVSGIVQADRARVSRGRIHFDGRDVTGLAPNLLAHLGVVHVLEGRHVFPQLSVEDNLRSGGFLRKLGRREMNAALERIYTWLPRLKVKRQTAAGLSSGGEQQMLALGRALMTGPRLVLLDEPSMGLAPMLVEEIFGIISHLNASENIGFVVAEQNINVALRHAHYGYVIENGRVVDEGPAQRLAEQENIHHYYLGGTAA